MYNKLRQKLQALTEEADVNAVATKLAQDTSDFEEVKDDLVEEDEIVKDEDEVADEILEAYLMEDDEEAVDEASDPNTIDNPRTFKGVAKKILRQQRKLGALKGLSVSVMSIDESRKNRLKKAGILSTAYISASLATGLLAAKEIEKKEIGKEILKLNFGKNPYKGVAKNNLKRGAVDAGIYTGATLALTRNNQTVVITADYKYGKKLFEVFTIKPKYKDLKLDKRILKEVTKQVAALKSEKEYVVKEDVSSVGLQCQAMSHYIVESVMEEALKDAANTLAIERLKKNQEWTRRFSNS